MTAAIDAHRAYAALATAAERIGANNFAHAAAEHRRVGRSPHTLRPVVSEAHQRVLDAMSDVLAGHITPEQAMAVLHEPEVLRERLG